MFRFLHFLDVILITKIPLAKVDLKRSRILVMRYESNVAISCHADASVVFTDVRTGNRPLPRA